VCVSAHEIASEGVIRLRQCNYFRGKVRTFGHSPDSSSLVSLWSLDNSVWGAALNPGQKTGWHEILPHNQCLYQSEALNFWGSLGEHASHDELKEELDVVGAERCCSRQGSRPEFNLSQGQPIGELGYLVPSQLEPPDWSG
jgi:hypothetical protein